MTGSASAIHRRKPHAWDRLSQLSSLLQDVMHLAGIKTGLTKLVIREFDLHALIESVALASCDSSKPSQNTTSTACSPSVPGRLKGELRTLRRILIRMARVSRSYTPDRAINITVWSAASARQNGIEVVFAVSDAVAAAPGEPTPQKSAADNPDDSMVPQQTQALFPELRLQRMLAAGLGGRLWLEKEHGAGFTCCLSMPLTIPPSAPNPAVQPDDGSAATGDPSDRLANLQLLAEKKKVPFHQEVDRYLSELTLELHHLETAIKAEQDTATYYAHLLCGRFSFIFERNLEQRLRQMEDLVTGQHWAEARRCFAELPDLMQDLHTRITTAVPIVRPE